MSPLQELERLEELSHRLLGGTRVTVGLLERDEIPDDALTDAWSRRRRQFRRFMAAHQRLAPSFEELGRGEGLTPQEAARAGRIMEEVRRVCRQVLELDRRAADLLTQERDKAGAELRRLGQGRKVRQAYGYKPTKCWGPSRISRTG